MTYRLLIAEGQWLTRRGLHATLHGRDGQEVVAEAASADEAERLAERSRTDLAVVGVGLPGGGAVAAFEALRRRRPAIKVLVLGDATQLQAARDVLRAGCDGFVSRDGEPHDLLEAVRRVREGRVHVDAETSRQLVLADLRGGDRVDDGGPLRLLSERELAVFRLIGAGYTTRAAAERIQLSPRTVEKYRAAVMQKLQLGSAVELRLLALRLGAASAAAAQAR